MVVYCKKCAGEKHSLKYFGVGDRIIIEVNERTPDNAEDFTVINDGEQGVLYLEFSRECLLVTCSHCGYSEFVNTRDTVV